MARCPFAVWDPISGSPGEFKGGPKKVVHHKTQGSTLTGARQAYKNNRSDPHFTVHENGTNQHIDTAYAARSLRNAVGGVQTNFDGAIQIETTGFSGVTMSPKTATHLVRLLQWLRSAEGVPWVWPSGRPPKTSTDGYGLDNGDRHAASWDRQGGHYGHSQVPENCVSVDTPMLCADLHWRRAGDLLPGDEIVAFDERSLDQAGRRFRTATVEYNHTVSKPCMTVHTLRGSVTASVDHPWLVYRNKKQRWVRTDELRPTDELSLLTEPWAYEDGRAAGWLAGMFDADGWLSRTADRQSGWMAGIGQRVSATLERAENALMSFGFEIKTIMRPAGRGGSNCQEFGQINVKGGLPEILRLVGSIRPERFVERNLSDLWEGSSVGRTVTRVPITSIVPVDTPVEVASIQTSTRTIVTGGFLTHNSHWDPAYTDEEWRFLNDHMGAALQPAPQQSFEVDVQLIPVHRTVKTDADGRAQHLEPVPIERVVGPTAHSEHRPHVDGRYDAVPNSVTVTPDAGGTLFVFQNDEPLSEAHVWFHIIG